MTDLACHFCGAQIAATQRFMFQGREVAMCYDCWDELVGTGDEDDPEPPYEPTPYWDD